MSALTVEEAKSKWCCNNTFTDGKCVGSQCMGWRWYSTIEETIYEDFGKALTIAPPKIKKVIYKPKDEWTGYCGLAGKP